MEIKMVAGDITKIKSDVILVNHFEDAQGLNDDVKVIDEALGGAISQLIQQGEIKGKLNEITIIYTFGKLPAARVAVVGLGKKSGLNLNQVRNAVADSCRFLCRKGIDSVDSVIQGDGIPGMSSGDLVQAITEGALLGTYSFKKHITRNPESKEMKLFSIIEPDKNKLNALEQSCRKGQIIADATNKVRDMVNEPANYMTPTDMANIASEIAQKRSLEVTVLEREQIKELGMGGLMGVSQGSQQPPKFIVLQYRGRNSDEVDIAYVGKGITFDSGGISIKPSEKMDEMKGDMAGGASVMLALDAIAQLKFSINIVAIVPATENLPSGSALKPGDIITALNGKTMEIISTDAEGRLILADGLSYATKKLNAKSIIDVATLTGACRVALGDICTGAFGNNQELIHKVIAAGAAAGECIWQMPMNDEYKVLNKSDVADVKNSGGRYAGAITAALFLAEFVDTTPWVHLDIAGTSMAEKEHGHLVKGATGVPVRTLINLAQELSRI